MFVVGCRVPLYLFVVVIFLAGGSAFCLCVVGFVPWLYVSFDVVGGVRCVLLFVVCC